MKKGLIVIVLVAAVGVGAYFYLGANTNQEIQYFGGAVERGEIQNTVAATGAVEALVTVQVGAQVTGQIQALYADFNSVVTQGQQLARLDPSNLQTQLQNAEANLVQARSRIRTANADLENQRTSVLSAEANLNSARVDLGQAETNLRRAQELFDADLVPSTELENARAQLESARARVVQQEASLEQARSQIVSREAAIEQAEAQLVQAQAQVDEAQVNLGYTDIRSPVDGVVISREVDVGQTVSASTSAPTLFQIANDLSRMRVQASIDEADIGLLATNNDVTFTVDAYPTERFSGEIEQIRLNPTTTQNVVTYSVIVAVDNPDLKLKPGMTANLTIIVDSRENVLTVPNTALRYTPPGMERPSAASGRTSTTGLSEPAAASGAVADAGGSQQFEGRTRGDFGGRGLPEGFDPAAFEGFAARGGRGNGGGRGGSAQSSSSTGISGNVGEAVELIPGVAYTGAQIQFQAAPPQPPRPGAVFVMNAAGQPELRELMIGITDGTRTEVVSGDIAEGDQVMIGDTTQVSELNTSDGDGNRNMMRMMRGGGGGWR